MEPRSLEYVARACQADLRQGHPATLVRRVCTDSRKLEAADLFFALTGPSFDGHLFVEEAARKRAAAVVVAEAKADQLHPTCPLLRVDDPRSALGRLATCYRHEFDLPVIAVAGSNGKTTTKNLLTAVLHQKFQVLSSEASFNNDVGVPLTLLRLERQHQAAILEAGTNHPGELAPLLRMIKPHFGILTSLGGEHLEFFENLEGVAQEEGWLAELLPPQGRLFVNGDSPGLSSLKNRTAAPIVPVGLGGHNLWRAENIQLSMDGTTFSLTCPRKEFEGPYQLRLLGRHQVVLALLALALGAELGLTSSQAQAGLAECLPASMRMDLREYDGIWILDDAYNANVDSMKAALETCRDLACTGRRIAILGDMAELGRHSPAAHETVGKLAAQAHLDMLVAVGQWRHHTARAARAAGLQSVHDFESIPAAAAFVQDSAQPGDLLLLKASRAAGFERLSAQWRTDS